MQKHEHWRRQLLRTDATAKKYENVQNEPQQEGCRLCNEKVCISEYSYWRLVTNAFPYDKYFSKSDMLVAKRHIDEPGLTTEEKAEFVKLKNTVLNDDYDLIFENLLKQKSIPHHIHYHLAELRRPE